MAKTDECCNKCRPFSPGLRNLYLTVVVTFSGAYVGPSIPLAPANVAANGGGSPLRPRTSPPPPPPPAQENANDNSQSNHHQVRVSVNYLFVIYIYVRSPLCIIQ